MPRVPQRCIHPLLAVCAALFSASAGYPAAAGEPVLTTVDERGVRDALERYRAAWLTNDPANVLSTFDSDAVLVPAGGAAPLTGREAISRYWWPTQGPSTSIKRFDQPVLSVSGSGGFASAYGTSVVEWTTGTDPTRQASRSQWSAVLRQGTDGRWSIRMLAWELAR